jgi:hypothetical protein
MVEEIAIEVEVIGLPDITIFEDPWSALEIDAGIEAETEAERVSAVCDIRIAVEALALLKVNDEPEFTALLKALDTDNDAESSAVLRTSWEPDWDVELSDSILELMVLPERTDEAASDALVKTTDSGSVDDDVKLSICTL